MANITFHVRTKTNPSKITVRFRVGRDLDMRKTTPININPKYFNNKTGKIKHLAEYKEKDTIQNQLNNLETALLSEYNKTVTSGGFINSDWLATAINRHFNIIEVTDLNYLTNYFKHYIETIKLKTNDKTGLLGTSKATITKYETIARKIEALQKHTKKKYRLTDVDLKFRDVFLNYLINNEQLSRNTAGRYIKFLKTVCLHAQKSGYKTALELAQIKGFRVEVKKIYLSLDELAQIEDTAFSDERLQDAKDWLLIGCYIGQRASDLLHLTNENIKHYNGRNFIELVQQKTKKRVTILIPPIVQDILDKRNGQFPPQYSDNIQSANAIFNRLIKRVCYLAGLRETVNDIGKVNSKTARKETGNFPKWQLVTSHICRRSFATNFYGEMPTPLLMNITAHSTEKEFLNYIGKTPLDYAEQMAMYWDMLAQKQKKTTILKAVK